MIIVSNSSPLVALAGIGQAHLLAAQYGSIIVPEAVWLEVVERALDKPGVVELRQATWLEHRPVAESELMLVLQESLDQGEKVKY